MSGDRTYRGGKLTIAWQPHGLIGRVTLDGAHWANVEWSEKRWQSVQGFSAANKTKLDRAKAIYRKLTGVDWMPRPSKTSRLMAQISAQKESAP